MSVSARCWHDPESWNRFVAATPGAHFQQSWEWGELADELGGRPHRIAAIDGGRILATMHIVANPIALTGRTYLDVARGPTAAVPSVQVLGPLFDAAREVGLHEHAIGIRVEPNAPACNPAWKTTLSALGLRAVYPPSQPRSSWLLDIGDPDDTLLANMKQKTRYNVRLAAKKGVDVSAGTEADLDAFYALYTETAERDGFFIHDRRVYARMFSLFGSTDSFCMLLARHNGRLIAAITLVRWGSTCWYLQGASSGRDRNLMAPYLLQWEGIQQAKRWGCTRYDFRAVPDVLREDQDMYGVYRFKEGFGGYHTTTLNAYAAPYRPVLFGLWQLWFRGRFEAMSWQRRRHGLPERRFA
jgi:lipid II:glycine glycyltransferase (peptidoglycan interpeptide bridge formation enzyme)